MPGRFEGYMAVLFVEDLARARDFYENVLGLPYVNGDEQSAYLNLDPDGLMLINHVAADDLLSAGDVDHEVARAARSVMVTEVDDVDSLYEELRAKGVEFIRTPEDRSWGLRCAHFKDPDGNVWEIHTKVEKA